MLCDSVAVQVDLSVGSVSSVSSMDSDCGREFMDVLQVCPPF